jgi:hypothetical protein
MTGITGQSHADRILCRLTWVGPEVAALEQRPPDCPDDLRWSRLTRLDRCVLAAACAVDRTTGGALRSAGSHAAVVIRMTSTSADGIVTYLQRLHERYGGMYRDFAQLGGPSTYHYIAKYLGVRGYATVLVDDLMGAEPAGLIEDAARMPGIDTVCAIRVHLRRQAPNPLVNALAPQQEDSVAALLLSAEDGRDS